MEKSDILKEADDGDGYVEYKKLFSSWILFWK